ncbi:ABC transporter permease [Raoultibacter phocaeensis]|uniref:ABC transporter permease n=1 Tax=Raoultibacter phocaeensis TaxID=2479841 RepID=UPI00111BCAD9|nr:ABC transporter permease [Raoultibacter phocaeensis]
MKAFWYGALLQWKIDIRRKDVLVMYYLMPLAFFLFMGGIFSSIDAGMKETLVYAMSVFAVCAGALCGVPTSVVSFYGTGMKNAYKVGGVPVWTAWANSFVSAVLHLAVTTAVIAVLAPIVFGAQPVADLPRFIGVAVSFTLSLIAVGALLGLLAKSQTKLSMAAMMLFLVCIMLSGIMLPDQFLPEAFRTVGEFLPSRWAYEAFSGVEVPRNVGLLLGLCAVCVTLAAVRLKVIASRE